MSLNPKLSAASRNLALNAALDVLNSGFMDIYSGTQPTDADTALSGNTLLSYLTFGATAFGAASSGSKTANAITQDSDADATGTASFFRLFKSDHTTAVADGSAGTATANLVLNSTAIQIHAAVQCSSLVYSMAA